MLLFLVQTVGRQSIEQRQFRPPRSRGTGPRKTPIPDIGKEIGSGEEVRMSHIPERRMYTMASTVLYFEQELRQQGLNNLLYSPIRYNAMVLLDNNCSLKFFYFPDVEMPEHDLEPPRFGRRALERILNDWTAVKAMILSGKKESGAR